MISRTIATKTHGRYVVVPPPREPRGLLLGFHGYAEPAEAALARLQAIGHSDEWLLVAVQGLNRFYRGRTSDIIASWMTSQDRDLAIADNIRYVAAVVDVVANEWQVASPLVLTGFSQGVAMAYRAACASLRSVSGVISLGGDVPPELDGTALSRLESALVGRGARDDWYTNEKFRSDLVRLRAAAVDITDVTVDAGHEWTNEFSEAAAAYLNRVRRRDRAST
jgi:predicted esterase